MFDELKSVAKHFLVYGFGNILSKIVGFLLIPLYTHYLAADQYGTLELLELTTYIAAMFLALGISQALTRFYYDSDDPAKRKQVVSTALLATWFIAILGMIALYLLSPSVSTIVFKSQDNTGLFRLVFITLMVSLANEIPLAYMRVQQKSILYTIVSLCKLTANLSLNILFIVSFGMGIRGIIVSGLIAQGAAAVFLTIYTFRNTGFSFAGKKLKEMVKYGLPYIPGGLGMFVLNFVDRFFLQRFATLSEVGIYSLGYKFGMIINPLVTDPFFSIWRPKMFELSAREDAKDIYSVMLTYFLFLEIFVALGISVLVKDALVIMSNPEYLSAYKVVPLILLSYILWGSYFHVQVGILIEKKTKNIAVIVAISAVSNLILNYLLIPRIGMWGAAVATLSSFAIMFVLNYMISSRLLYVSYEIGRIAKLILAAVGLYLLSLGIHIDYLWLSILIKACLVASFPLVLFLLRFYTEREIAKMKEVTGGALRSLRLALIRQ